MKKITLIICYMATTLVIPQLGHSSDSTDFDAAGAAYTSGRYDIAMREFKRLAESGDSISAYNIALMYANGQGVSKDDMISAQWMRKSADAGYAQAQRHIALCMYNGEPGYNKSAVEAFKYFKLASDQGDLSAIYNLAIMVEHGESCQQNNEEAYRLYKIAAERGYASAQRVVGTTLLQGLLGQRMNRPEGLKWLQMAAEKNDAIAAYNLGKTYEDEKNKEALRWFKFAADLKFAPAQNAIGASYLKGHNGVKKDGVEAMKWFELAAKQGDPDALNSLGVEYYKGDYVKQDRQKGLDYLIKAAAAGSIDAKNNIKGLTGN